MIPKLLEKQVVEWHHNVLCYPGETCTELSIAQHFYWKNLRKTVHEVFSKCKFCQFLKRSTKQYRKLPPKEAESKSCDFLMCRPNRTIPNHVSPIQYPEAQPLDAYTSNDGFVDSSEEEYVDTNNENQSEKIVQDTNPPTNPPTKPSSDGGKLLRWNKLQEERRKNPKKKTLSQGKEIRRQSVLKSPITRNMVKTPRKNLQQKKRLRRR